LNIAVVLGAHENSPTYKDTLESVRHHLTNEVLVVVDGIGWEQFSQEDSIFKLQGFLHGKPSAPFRNVALGLMKAWETWGESADWYCHMEYDCLIGSSEIKTHLSMADDQGFWVLGNDHRTPGCSLPFLESFAKEKLELHYFLGCCVFFSSKFLKVLAEDDFFNRFLNFTNFRTEAITLVDERGKTQMAYDLSEYMYPTLAVKYGGKIAELACWRDPGWVGNYEQYPMRFRPDITVEDPYMNACVMHPVKNFDSPLREFHRRKRNEQRNAE
jgi:hypothetical protein